MESHDNMNDAEQMELALNSDFGSALLDCWEKSTKPEHGSEDGHGSASSTGARTTGTGSPRTNSHRRDSNSWASDLRLPSFSMEDDTLYERSFAPEKPAGDYSVPATAAPNATATFSRSDSGSSGDANAASNSSESSMSQQLPSVTASHRSPLPSSNASSFNGNKDSDTALHLHPLGIPSSATCPPHVAPPAPSMLQQQAQHPSLMPLACNALAAGLSFPNPLLFPHHHQMVPMQNLSVPAVQFPAAPTPAAPPKNRQTTKRTKAATRKQKKAAAKDAPPPFLLFDAPVELRANFINAQRSHGLPVMQDNNSYHYGMAVNGFHPQDHLNGGGGATISTGGSVKLIDGRHGDQGLKRLKNAKEQKRAQRITDLIEQLRDKMEDDGWTVGVKSKFHTLTSCADYVKHLTGINKEKEDAVKKAQCDLDIKRRKMEEESESQDPSDPGSSTSSMTSSSGSDSDGVKATKSTAGKSGSEKKPRLSSHESSISSSSEQASVSDLTYSNVGSSSGTDEAQLSNESESRLSSEKDDNAAVASHQPGASSGFGGKGGHADVVIKGRKRKRSSKQPKEEKTSLDRNFKLDYEDVFVNSNIPQLLATTSGRVIAWNDFFLRATGFTSAEMDHLTIFSLVQTNKLSNVFEIVAAALRTNALPAKEDVASDETKAEDSEKAKEGPTESSEPKHPEDWDHEAMTLPCVRFRPLQRDDGVKKPKSLSMTLTFMADEDPKKRCFHCVFTDSAGADGSLGSITPELLSLLLEPKNAPDVRRSRPFKSKNKRKKVSS